ncbi:MAG TPA: hypothetical protein VLD84_02330, partial [Nitrososphaeraceae archaeon]|nr:hypothetical protein [Nitrososphaeraceae archaeon]
MKLSVERKIILSLVSTVLITGIAVYIVLSYLLIPMKITVPVCVSMALLCFGLTRYYTIQLEKNISVPSEAESLEASSHHHSTGNEKNVKDKFSKIIFASIYLILIAACAFSIPRVDVVYVSWNLLDMVNIFQLVAAIMLCFLMPGYAIVTL